MGVTGTVVSSCTIGVAIVIIVIVIVATDISIVGTCGSRCGVYREVEVLVSPRFLAIYGM